MLDTRLCIACHHPMHLHHKNVLGKVICTHSEIRVTDDNLRKDYIHFCECVNYKVPPVESITT
jgi:hypothetical protein